MACENFIHTFIFFPQHLRRPKSVLPWDPELLLPSLHLKWSWLTTTSPPSLPLLRKVAPSTTTWNSSSATSSPPTSERLSPFSSPLLLASPKPSFPFSFSGSTWSLTVSPPPLLDSTPQIWTSWRSPHVHLRKPWSPRGCSSATWPSVSTSVPPLSVELLTGSCMILPDPRSTTTSCLTSSSAPTNPRSSRESLASCSSLPNLWPWPSPFSSPSRCATPSTLCLRTSLCSSWSPGSTPSSSEPWVSPSVSTSWSSPWTVLL